MSPKGGLVLGLLIQSHFCLSPRREPSLQVMVVGAMGGGRREFSAQRERRMEEVQLPWSGSVLAGSGPAHRLKVSGEDSCDPQIPITFGLGDIVFSERKEMEVWASAGTLVS